MKSLFEPPYPTVFFLEGYKSWMMAKINPEASAHDALRVVEAVCKKVAVNVPFDCRLAEQEYALKFAAEERIGKLAIHFASGHCH